VGLFYNAPESTQRTLLLVQLLLSSITVHSLTVSTSKTSVRLQLVFRENCSFSFQNTVQKPFLSKPVKFSLRQKLTVEKNYIKETKNRQYGEIFQKSCTKMLL